MKITTKYRLNFVVFGLLCIGSYAQETQNKLSKKFTVNQDVKVNLNTSHTNIIFETWNKNALVVEAYLEGDLSDDNSKHILDSWQIDASGDHQEIYITSAAGNLWGKTRSSTVSANQNTQELRVLEPAIADMLESLVDNIAQNAIPVVIKKKQNVSSRRNSNANDDYVQQWERQIREKFIEDIHLEKEKWKQRFIYTPESITKSHVAIDVVVKKDANAEKMNILMPHAFQGYTVQKNGVHNNIAVFHYNTISTKNKKNVVKVIKIYMPHQARLALSTRHGEVRLPQKVNNVKASLTHTKLSANIINGGKTFIKASYAPVFVHQWNHGRLVVNYVKNCRIQGASNLSINADSSNIYIQELNENSAISGSFGAITIAHLGESFSTLDLAVQNSDLKITLPKTAFNFSYTGAQSMISLPKTLTANMRRNFGNVFVNGFQNTRNTSKIITINAKYSEVLLNNKK